MNVYVSLLQRQHFYNAFCCHHLVIHCRLLNGHLLLRHSQCFGLQCCTSYTFLWQVLTIVTSMGRRNRTRERTRVAWSLSHRVPLPKIVEGARFAAQFLVHDRWEVDIQNHIVVDGQPQHNAHQCKLSIILKAVGVEPEGTCLIVEAEHGCKVGQVNVSIPVLCWSGIH